MEDTGGGTAVDKGVGAIQIAQRFLQAVRSRFVHEPRVIGISEVLASDRQAEFKRHVEAWRVWPSQIQLYSREIVYREGALTDKIENPFQPPPTFSDLQCGTRYQTQRADTSNVGKTQVLELAIVRKVEKDASGRFASLRRLSSCSSGRDGQASFSNT